VSSSTRKCIEGLVWEKRDRTTLEHTNPAVLILKLVPPGLEETYIQIASVISLLRSA
jgi:hypothetical protein